MRKDIIILEINEAGLSQTKQALSSTSAIVEEILEESLFQHQGLKGPYRVIVSIEDYKAKFLMEGEDEESAEIFLPLSPLRRIIKDYIIVCDHYFDAIKTADSHKVEAIDMGRRGLHNEGAEILEDLLRPEVETDFNTARKLFSLLQLLYRP